ncbi:hypothetical protein JCM11251_002609 [Rhodosporidiobolus azoricus]
MFAAAALAASLAAAGVHALPVAQLATVEAALSPSNTTHYNETVVSYKQNGNAGACGWYSKDSDIVVGLPLEQYSDLGSASPFCGQFVVVTDPRDNTTVTALVADASATNNTLSVSQGTWEALNGTASALEYVDWRFANQTETEGAKAALENGSSSSSSEEETTTYEAPSSTYVAPSSTSSAWSAPASSSAAAQTYQAEEKKETTTTSYKPTTTAQAYTTTTSYAPKTTTTTWSSPKAETTQAAATKQAQSYSSSSGSGTYSGHATYFYQNGNPGACGNYNSDSTYLVALQSSMYAGGSHCGKMITINRGGKSIQAKVQDECPSCTSTQSIDLSVGAFTAIASESEGQVDITWSWA